MAEKKTGRELTVMSAPEPEILALVDVPGWCDPRHIAAAWALSEGSTKQAAADAGGVDRATIYDWLKHPERGAAFERLVKDLTAHTGYAKRSHTLRRVKSLMRQAEDKGIEFALRKHDWVDLARFALDLSGDRAVSPGHPVLQFIQNVLFEGPTTVRIGESGALPAGDVVDVDPVVLDDGEE